MFEHIARNDTEISLYIGKSIKILNYVGKGTWSYGEDLDGNKGSFPSDYVQLIDRNTPELHSLKLPDVAKNNNPKFIFARVNFDYKANNFGEMNLMKDEIIEIAKLGDSSDWSWGTDGKFPTSFVSTDDSEKHLIDRTIKNYYARTLFDFTSKSFGDLSIKSGSFLTIYVLGKPGGWSRGQDCEGN